MLFKSREHQVHEHICKEIENRLAALGAPGAVRHFLLERWSYLLAGIYFSRGDQNPDWEAGWHTVNALLWSLTPKRDLEETEQFLRLLPTLLGRLHDGCDAMNLAGRERDELFTQLALLHAAVTRDSLQAANDAEGPTTQLGRDADLEFSEAELASLGGGESVPVQPMETAPEEAASPTLEDLKVGAGIHLHLEGRDKTLYLQWISPGGGMYLFADQEGYDAVSLTRARLAEKLARGEAALGK